MKSFRQYLLENEFAPNGIFSPKTGYPEWANVTRLAQVLKLHAADQSNQRIEMTKELVSRISGQMYSLDLEKSNKIHRDINAGRSPYRY